MNVEEAGVALDRPSVLVVDDERTLCTLASDALGAAGFSVQTAVDGEAALKLLETFRPDLILLDVLLPGVDGITLCRQLRAAPETRDTPICIMTGLDDRISIQQAFEAGATDFVIKPPSWVILSHHLLYLRRANRVARELSSANIRLQLEISERERTTAALMESEAELRKLSQAESDQRRLAEALRDAAAALNGSLKLDEVLDRILDSIGKIAVCDAVFMVMLEGDGARLTGHRGMPLTQTGNACGQAHYRLADLPLLGPLLATRLPCLIADTADDPTCASGCRMIPGSRSCLGIPLEIRGSVVGAIVLTSATPGLFTAASAERLRSFANQASVAIDNARLFQQAHHLSVTDGLTGLNNRRHFFDLAKVEYERIRRYGRALSVVMIDIDQFKKLNDAYGHLVGDAVLREVARRLQETVRTIDTLARYGGEEFVVLMPETDLAEALLVAERVRQSVAEPPVVDNGVTVSTTISLGVAELDEQCTSLEDALKCADQALYAAKTAGRNRVEAYRGAGVKEATLP
jgi:diguanylate cyclase (GGDEF)-like protein